MFENFFEILKYYDFKIQRIETTTQAAQISVIMRQVRTKKKLGQHFLKDHNIAQKIVNSLQADGVDKVLEIGPGMGILTRYLLKREKFQTYVVEFDNELAIYLMKRYPELQERVIAADFLQCDLSGLFSESFAVIGNFPYNISSQIFFKILENRNQIPEIVCMVQKEVAERLSATPGSKIYGILSVLMQAFYKIDYLFTVNETVFDPPPKVKSAIIRMTYNGVSQLDCSEVLFKRIVKTGFNQRRKILRNSLKNLLGAKQLEEEVMGKRPEQLNIREFVKLTQKIEELLQT